MLLFFDTVWCSIDVNISSSRVVKLFNQAMVFIADVEVHSGKGFQLSRVCCAAVYSLRAVYAVYG